jgi:ABC-type dipeptide/oligopeptide/nickel transport system ATPase component
MYGTSFILVSHDMGLHYQATDRIAIMYAGKIVETGRTENVFKKPLHPYSEGLIKSIPGGLLERPVNIIILAAGMLFISP